jgi:hypothetical protein
MTPLMLVDSIALEVTTAADSTADMFDDIFLNLGGEHRWQLNFPNGMEVFSVPFFGNLTRKGTLTFPYPR